MTGRTRSGAFLHAIRLLIPESEIRVIYERPWHSLTFAGTQLCLSARFQGSQMMCKGEEFCASLTDFEFDLPGQLVADIAVTQAVVANGAYCLMIDALLLDD